MSTETILILGGSYAGISAAPFDGFVRGLRRTMQPWLGSAAYANYADPGIADYATAYWGANLARLRKVKRRRMAVGSEPK